jgi:hypothetical protein
VENIKLSSGTQPILRRLSAQTIQLILDEHRANRVLRRVTTPDNGTHAITVSFHSVWHDTHPVTVVLVENLLTRTFHLYTVAEFKAFLRASRALRAKQRFVKSKAINACKPLTPAPTPDAEKASEETRPLPSVKTATLLPDDKSPTLPVRKKQAAG